jgi:hypothetical protein
VGRFGAEMRRQCDAGQGESVVQDEEGQGLAG